jgi:hypothetical protein
MAHIYFTKTLLASNLNLSEVFSDKQDKIKDALNVSYSLYDIAKYLEDVTNNFKSQQSDYIDMDSAILDIINKYYKSTGIDNPFVKEFKKVAPDTYQQGVVPSETLVVDAKDKKVINKGVVSPKIPEKSEPVVEAKVLDAQTEPSVEKTLAKADDLIKKIESFKKSLTNAKTFLEIADDEEEKQKEIFDPLRRVYSGFDILDEDEMGEFEKWKKQAIIDFFTENNEKI